MLTYDSFTPDASASVSVRGKRHVSLQMRYCDGCQVRLNGKRSYRHQTKAPTYGEPGESVSLCELCYKAALRADGTLPSVYEITCVACEKSVEGSARCGPHGVICHGCYNLSVEGQREIKEMQAWWRDHDLERRPPAPQSEQAASDASPVLDLGAQRKRRAAASAGSD